MTTITSPIVSVNVAGAPNIDLYLPAASNVIGQSYLIYDATGGCNTSNVINIIPVSGDTIDMTYVIALPLNNPYQSIRLFAQSATNYAVLQNSKEGGVWLA